MTSYTQRTLAWLRGQGFTVEVVERWLPNPKHPAGGVRKDFLGLADIVAVKPERYPFWKDPLTIAVQSTGPSGHAQHKRDMLANENLPLLLDAGWEVWLVSWRKLLIAPVGRAKVYNPAKHAGKAWKLVPRVERLDPRKQDTNGRTQS